MRVFCLLLLLWTSLSHAGVRFPCARDVAIGSSFKSGSAIIFGEMHGTREAPEYLLAAACSTLATYRQKPLLIGVELPIAEADRLATYVESSGNRADRLALLSGPFWTRPMQDGRSSHAMLELIDGLRQLRQRHPNLRIAPFVADPGRSESHDAAMARVINAWHVRDQDARVLILVGNLHAKRSAGFAGDPNFQSMARLLTFPNRSYAFASRNGTMWSCTTSCGIHPVDDNASAATVVNRRVDRPRASLNFDGLIDLGAVTASPPAINGPAYSSSASRQ